MVNFSFTGIMTKDIRLSKKKAFYFLQAFIELSRARVMGRAFQGNFEKNVKFLLDFRKNKFKEIKKLNSYIKNYVQKRTSPPPQEI